MHEFVRTPLVLLLIATACSSSPDEPETSETEQAVWGNGDFEADAIGVVPTGGWIPTTNIGLAISDIRPNPQTLASLNLTSGGTPMTFIVGGAAPESQVDPDIGAGGTFRFPKYGNRAVRLNYKSASEPGKNANSNTLTQTMTVTAGDIDTIDNKAHIRFALAPVLQNPGHTYTQQPYYFVRLHNNTKGITLYQDFNASGQPGVPWKNFTDSGGEQAQYTDWQLVDIAPGDAKLAIGDSVELRVVATGCSPGGHWGRVYLDSVGSGIPGLYAWATGPQQANAGTAITYTLNYKNGGTTTTSNTKLDFTTPPSTTFASTTGSCTTPAAGGTGTLSCTLGTLAPGATGSFTVSVNIPGGTANGTVITNGTYSIYATSMSALIGPKVQTTVTNNVSYANLGATLTDGISAMGWGASTQYTMVVTNTGPLATAGTVTVPLPTQAASMSWSCVASGAAVCPMTGTGAIGHAVTVPVGETLTYTINATAKTGTGSGSLVMQATIATTGTTDPDTTDNTPVDTTSLGTLRTLTVTKATNPSAGTVSSAPMSIACGATCSGEFLDGSQVVLTATPSAGSTFLGWSGACAGTANQCTVTMNAARDVTASFLGAPTSIAATSGGAQSTRISTAFGSPLAVTVRDSSNNPVPGVTVTFAGPGTGARATLSAASAITNASGVAQVTATANATNGTYNVVATVASVGAASFALTNIGTPATISVVSGTPQSTQVQTAFAPLVVLVRDSLGVAVPSATVTFNRPIVGASATGQVMEVTTTDTIGEAQYTPTANTIAGSFAMLAWAENVVTPASFALTNTPAAPHSLAVWSGDAQTPTVAAAFAAPLEVKLTDIHGNAIAGRAITFSAPSAGATATMSPTATTSALGIASISPTAGTVAGSYTIAAMDAAGPSVELTATNLPGAPSSISTTTTAAQTTTVATQFADSLEVEVRDMYGNLRPGTLLVVAPPVSGPSAIVAPSLVTGTSGRASTIANANIYAGTYPVTVAVASMPGLAATFTLTNIPGAPAHVAIIGGNLQTPTVAQPFVTPLVVKVSDQYDNPIPSTSVTFTAPASGATATLAGSPATTSAGGNAVVTATAGTVSGIYSITATAGTASVQFTATNRAGAPTAITAIGGGAQQATVTTAFATPLRVRVDDTYGNVVPNATVTFAPAATGASATLSSSSATTDGTGTTQALATANTVRGSHVVTASIMGASATFALTNLAGAPAALSIAGGATQSTTVDTAFSAPLVARVVDTYGNRVPDAEVAFAAPGSGASATVASSALTNDDGDASVTATANTSTGSYSVTASMGGHTVTYALTNTPDVPASIAITGGDDQTREILATFPEPLAVVVRDRFENAVPSATVVFSSFNPRASAVLTPTSASTDADGRASTIAVANSLVGDYPVTATVGGHSIAFTLHNVHSAPALLEIVSGANQSTVVATAFAAPLVVIARDVGGNVTPDAWVTFTTQSTAANAALSATSVKTDSEGRASITASASSTSGSYVVDASMTGTNHVAFPMTNTADVPFAITVAEASSPQTTTVLAPFAVALAARVADRFDNPVPNAAVAFTAPASGTSSTLGAPSLTNAAGISRVTANANAIAGTYVVNATVAGVTTPAAYSLTNTAGAPVRLAIAGGGSQSTKVATAFAAPLAVRVFDANNNPVPNATVMFAAPDQLATATLATPTLLTDAMGIATTTATASTRTGTYDVTAALAGGASSVAFALTNTASAPASLTVDELSTPQNAQVAHPFSTPLWVTIRDQYGNRVPGAAVTFTAPATQATATLSAATGTTSASGRTSVVATAGTTVGTYVVTASIAGLSGTFTLKNLQGPPSTLLLVGGDHQSTIVGTAFAEPLVVRVEDEFHNAVVNAEVTFVAPASGATAMVATAATTGPSGNAQVPASAGTVTGAYTVIATVEDATMPIAFELENTAGAPAAIVVAADAATQSTEVGHAFARPLALTVRDAFDNRVPNATVTYSAPATGASAQLSRSEIVTDANGSGDVLAIANTTAASYEVTASVGEVTAAFALTNTPTAPGSIVLESGGGQHALATTAFAEPIVLRVIDSFGNPVSGVTVTASMPTIGATASLATAMAPSDDDGYIDAVLVAGPVVGTFGVSFGATGVHVPLVASLTVDAIPTTLEVTAPTELPIDMPLPVTIVVSAQVGTPAGRVEITNGSTVVATGELRDGRVVVEVPLTARGQQTFGVRYPAQGSFGASSGMTTSIAVVDDAGSLSGGTDGCSAGGGNAGWLVMVAFALVLGGRRRIAVAAAAAASLVAIAPALAEPAGSRSINRMHAPGADSTWFTVESLDLSGHNQVAVSMLNDFATSPLVAYDADGNVRGTIVARSYIVHVGGSVSLFDRFRLSATAPVSLSQSGDDASFNGMTLGAPTFAFGDMLVGADARVLGSATSPLRLAAGVRFSLPTGSRTNYMSDGVVGVEPRIMLAGSAGPVAYAATASAFLHEQTSLAGLTFGNELRYSVGAGVRMIQNRLVVGPELVGARAISSNSATGAPSEVTLGARFAATPAWHFGLAAGIGLGNAPGNPDERVMFQLGWRN